MILSQLEQMALIHYVANDSISGFDANETLTDTFTYTLSDEHDATDTATLTITLLGQDNEAPSATDNTNAVNEDATVTVTNGTSGVTGDVLINDTDPESDTLTVTKIKKSGGSDLMFLREVLTIVVELQ